MLFLIIDSGVIVMYVIQSHHKQLTKQWPSLPSSLYLYLTVTPASGGPTQFVKLLKQSQFHSLPRQAQVKGKETGTQRCTQEQRRDREERRKTKRPSTTRCVQINTARPASNPDTLTVPPPTKTPRPRGGRKKKQKW